MFLQWVGRAEQAASDTSDETFLIWMLCALSAIVFMCWCSCVCCELYKLHPAWGPVVKFDSDGNEEMRINQLILHQERAGYEAKKMKKGEKNQEGKVDFLKGALQNASSEFMSVVRKGHEVATAKGGRGTWNDMPDLEKRNWLTLGWTRETWDRNHAPATMNKFWAQLSNDEKNAARKLGFDAVSWDRKSKEANGPQQTRDDSLYSGFQPAYGSIGPCTWGYCESPYQWGEKMWDPNFGEVVRRYGFADSQWMREHSGTWARDEPHFMQKDGLSFPPLTLEDESAINVSHRMVYERHGY